MTDPAAPTETVAGPVCPACGEPLLPGDRFCEGCGHDLGKRSAPVTAVCAACGATTEIVDGYCGECGMKQPSPRDHIEAAGPGVGAVTDRGRSHHRNEDAMAVVVEAGRVIAVVCDGTSTSVDSDKASQAAADAGAAVLAAADPDDPADPDVAGAFDAARKAVLAMPYVAHAELDPPTCTYLAAVIRDDEAILASLGDCRSYWIDADGARALTTDDSWVTEVVARGEMTEEAAMAEPQGHTITRWISVDADPQWRPKLSRFEVPGPGRLVLCSDGLWNYTIDAATLPEQIARSAGAGDDALATARRLVSFANQAGGHDNITAVIVELPLPPPAGEEKGAGAA
ncbi:MAG: PP2C family serine/threonine-protein phosphatase [Acidimicrobiales bacterium]